MNQGAGMHLYRWEESGCKSKHGQAWCLFRSEVCLWPFCDLTMDEEANDCVCVLDKQYMYM